MFGIDKPVTMLKDACQFVLHDFSERQTCVHGVSCKPHLVGDLFDQTLLIEVNKDASCVAVLVISYFVRCNGHMTSLSAANTPKDQFVGEFGDVEAVWLDRRVHGVTSLRASSWTWRCSAYPPSWRIIVWLHQICSSKPLESKLHIQVNNNQGQTLPITTPSGSILLGYHASFGPHGRIWEYLIIYGRTFEPPCCFPDSFDPVTRPPSIMHPL